MLDTDDRMVEHLAHHATRPEVRRRLAVLLRLIDDEGATAPFSQAARSHLNRLAAD